MLDFIFRVDPGGGDGLFAVFPPTWGRVGDISIIFPCSFAVGITQQYGIHVLLG